jgi:alpha-1,3-glucosyltransferase
LTNIPAAPYLKLPVDSSAVQSVTRGLVGDTAFAVLPNVTPRMTFVLTLAAQIVSLSQSGSIYRSNVDNFF